MPAISASSIVVAQVGFDGDFIAISLGEVQDGGGCDAGFQKFDHGENGNRRS
ncbi:MAG: hypothetical protein QOD99_183 [Chthoniobacter sp.]|jgi:hypothetical protein|nr:hypothetical protein [Chthoniobacter sp.]